jgi:hypothetical protein
VALSPACNPAIMDIWDMRTAESLVVEAVSAGVITCPADGWSFRPDFSYDDHGGLYLWRVTPPGEIPFSLAAPEWLDRPHLGYGMPRTAGALEVLREAVRAANALIAG